MRNEVIKVYSQCNNSITKKAISSNEIYEFGRDGKLGNSCLKLMFLV